MSGGGGVNTTIADAIAALTNKKITLGNHIFNGISKIHSAHSFNYTVTKAATCTAAGSKTGTCACGNIDTQSIAAIGHSYGDWITGSDGATKTRTCSKCGNKETATIVELKSANTATKSKYNFKTINSFTLQQHYYYATLGNISGSGGGSGDTFDVFKEVNPTSCPAGSIIYIPNDISTSHSNYKTYTLNKNYTISAGYYKIKAICKRSSSMCGGTYTSYTIDSVNQSSVACNLIPFGMWSGYGYGNQYGSTSYIYTEDQILQVLQNYIEYLGTSYKVPQV